MKTTSELAAIIGCTPSRVREVARNNGIGRNITTQTKVFSETEAKAMQRLMKQTGMGRPRISKNAIKRG